MSSSPGFVLLGIVDSRRQWQRRFVVTYAPPLPSLALGAPQVRVILLDIRTQRDGYHAFNIAHRKFKFAAMIGAMLR